jgi:hypothetical protein
MITAAIGLALAGWPLIPCREVNTDPRPGKDNSKAPYKDADLRLENGHLDATTDLGKIIEWWTRWPNAMIGARVPDSLIVIDGDPRNNPDWLNELVALVGAIPETLTAWSGRNDGGRHFYFMRQSGETTSTKLPAGVDLKKNGYCIVPPSIHPATGQPYRWEHHPVAVMPYALSNLLRPTPRVPRVPDPFANKDGSALVRTVKDAQDGSHHNTFVWACFRARDDGILDELQQRLIDAAVFNGYDPKDAERVVESVRKSKA